MPSYHPATRCVGAYCWLSRRHVGVARLDVACHNLVKRGHGFRSKEGEIWSKGGCKTHSTPVECQLCTAAVGAFYGRGACTAIFSAALFTGESLTIYLPKPDSGKS